MYSSWICYWLEGYRDHTFQDSQAKDIAGRNVNIWTGKRERIIWFWKLVIWSTSKRKSSSSESETDHQKINKKNHQTTFFPKSFLMRKEIEAILGRITLTLHSPTPCSYSCKRKKKKKKDKDCSSWSLLSYRNTTAECPCHSQTIELPGVSLHTLHEQKRTE